MLNIHKNALYHQLVDSICSQLLVDSICSQLYNYRMELPEGSEESIEVTNIVNSD